MLYSDCKITTVDMIGYIMYECTPRDSRGFIHGYPLTGDSPQKAYDAMCSVYGTSKVVHNF